MEIMQGGSTAKTLDFYDNDAFDSLRFLPLGTEVGIQLRTTLRDGVWVGDDGPSILDKRVFHGIMNSILLRHGITPYLLPQYTLPSF